MRDFLNDYNLITITYTILGMLAGICKAMIYIL